MTYRITINVQAFFHHSYGSEHLDCEDVHGKDITPDEERAILLAMDDMAGDNPDPVRYVINGNTWTVEAFK